MIRLQEREDHPCIAWPLSPFDSFLIQSDEPPDIDLEIRVTKHLPVIPYGRLIFDACHGLWKLYAAESGYALESLDPHTLEPRSRATISRDIAKGEVWICAQPNSRMERVGWVPMHIINPIVEVCLVTRLARDGGLLLHAAGLWTEQGGLAFTGASGAGKSTISDFYAARGARVLSDERVILRVAEGATQVFGTPWPGAGRHARNQHSPLTGLFCIRHGEDGHLLRRMPPSTVVPFILQQCFLPHWNRAAMDGTLAFLGALLKTVDCFELAFMKTPDIVEFLEEQRQGRALVPS